MKAVAAAHANGDHAVCLAALDEFGDSLRAHLRKQYAADYASSNSRGSGSDGGANGDDSSLTFPRPPKACTQVCMRAAAWVLIDCPRTSV